MQIQGFPQLPNFNKLLKPGDWFGGDGTKLSPSAAKQARVEKLMRGITNRWDEKEILSILKGCTKEELNNVLSGVNVQKLVNDVDDHLAGAQNKQALLGLLGKERVQDLTVENRAKFVSAIQAGKTRSGEERAIRNIFLATHGRDLTKLKLEIDRTDDHRDLHALLHHDIDDKGVRDSILQHIAKEAPPAEDFKLCSDIDDTFYCNWIDSRYPKGTVYPGVRTYYREMDKAQPGQPDDLTFITARPDDRIGVVKKKTKKSLKKRGLREMVVLPGDVPSLLSNERLAEKKFENMGQLRKLYPEFNLVFTGDSGQGDAICGKMLHKAAWPGYHATLIHDVKNTSPEERARYREQRVYFFDTYVGAALEAHELGLMGLDGARRVGEGAAEDFVNTAFKDEGQRQARLGELQRDLARLNALLPPEQHVKVSDLKPLSELKLPELPDLENAG